MIVVMAGRVRVSVVSEDGKEITLTVLGHGEVLGEMSLLDGEASSADVTAQEDCVLLVIERSQFLDLLRNNSGLCLQLMTLLTRRLRQTNAALEDMALLDLPTRFGRLLTRLAKDYGIPVRTGTRIEVKLSQKDLSTIGRGIAGEGKQADPPMGRDWLSRQGQRQAGGDERARARADAVIHGQGDKSWGRGWKQTMAAQLRLITGLTLFYYVSTHLLNHALGNVSIAAMEAGMVMQKLAVAGACRDAGAV